MTDAFWPELETGDYTTRGWSAMVDRALDRAVELIDVKPRPAPELADDLLRALAAKLQLWGLGDFRKPHPDDLRGPRSELHRLRLRYLVSYRYFKLKGDYPLFRQKPWALERS